MLDSAKDHSHISASSGHHLPPFRLSSSLAKESICVQKIMTVINFQVLGAVGTLPGIFVKLEVSYHLLKRLLGVRTEGDKKAAKVQKLTRHEV